MINDERFILNYLNVIANWIDLHNGNLPSRFSNDPIERKYANFIYKLKLEYKNEKLSFNIKYIKYMEERGYDNIFNIINLGVEWRYNYLISKICDWVDRHHGKIPLMSSNNKQELFYAYLLFYIRCIKHKHLIIQSRELINLYRHSIDMLKKTKKSKMLDIRWRRRFYNSFQSTAIERGYPNLFIDEVNI